jgi:hypothetical protein
MRTAAWGFGEDDDLKAILGQFAALLVRPAPGRSADRRVAGQSLVCSVAVGPLRRVPRIDASSSSCPASSSSSLSSPYPSLA